MTRIDKPLSVKYCNLELFHNGILICDLQTNGLTDINLQTAIKKSLSQQNCASPQVGKSL